MAAGARIRDNLLLLAFFSRERRRKKEREREGNETRERIFHVGIWNANSDSENSSCIDT